ncbi:MAG: hypothetical protein HY755_06525 [Nitrospirae bacterium]|nr:hypothetical protein [Nitrospirota bacterium]
MGEVSENNLQKRLCSVFCSYYKPSKNNELACMGFLVIKRLTEKGIDIRFEKSDKSLGAETKEVLIKDICTACQFYKDDCDFAGNKKDALPCGGFLALGYLLDANIISVDDIKNAG